MPLEKKVHIMEGAKIAMGAKDAYFMWSRFHHLYPSKHGSCLEYVQDNADNTQAFAEYTRREQDVFRRYAMMYVHTIERLRLAAREIR